VSRQQGTSTAVLVAAGAFIGALVPGIAPPWAAGVAGVAGLIWRQPLLLALTVALLTSTLAVRSWDGLVPQTASELVGTGTIVTDPVRSGRSTTAVVRIDGRRYLAGGYGAAGAGLAGAHAGDHISVTGRTRPYGGSRERKAALHVGERLSLDSASTDPSAQLLWVAANGIRDVIGGGADHLGPERGSLFTGIVYGDDREQSPDTEVDFRLAGLTHLLAVSGQNVAYALTVARPLIQRRSLAGRYASSVGLLVLFATVTRFEPSVLRATVMAGLAVTAQTLGREADSGRLLSLAVTALLIIDPLLAETVAFRLSVAASAGIVWLSPIIRDRLCGPLWFRESMAVTLAAQLAVAPVLTSTFGPVSLVSIPANLAAGPVAGAVMAWGMTAGVVAGVAGGVVARVIHWFTSGALAILEWIAGTAAAAPMEPVGLDWIACAVVLVTLRCWWRSSKTGLAAVAVIVVAMVWALVPATPRGLHRVGWESHLEVGIDTVVLELGGEGDPVRLFEDLARLGVREIDTLVAGEAAPATVSLLRGRIDIGAVVGGP
jgi:competence protein ComEC